MKFVKDKEGSKIDIVVVVIILIIFIIAIASVLSKKPEKKELEEEKKEETKEVAKPIVSDETKNLLKCTNSSCSLDCEDGLCECTYTDPDTKTEEIIYCEMWK